MGSSGSKHTYKTHAEREAERAAKAERIRKLQHLKMQEEERQRQEQREKEAWLREYRAAAGLRGEKAWWDLERWPLVGWWKERKAWKAEKARRRGRGVGEVISDWTAETELRAHRD